MTIRPLHTVVSELRSFRSGPSQRDVGRAQFGAADYLVPHGDMDAQNYWVRADGVRFAGLGL